MADSRTVKVIDKSGPTGFVWFAAFVGALVYFVQHSEGFGGFLLAVLKAIVWPGIITHRALELLGL